ncbi:MAG: CPBP family intramembrane metalloprotease [Clostridia bacterium]|nr:CPBP family intramembrane metalloprotease [Clostridia bacterium]
MAIIETIIEPAYFVKSVLKIIFFLFVPLVFIKLQKEKVFADSFSLNKKSVLKLLGLGLIIYVIIMAAFFLTRGIFNYTSLVNSLSADQNVSQNSFIWIALYISFCNSLLEEFLFRFVGFIKLSEYTTKNAAYIFSSCMFALYHVAMIGGSFPLPLLLIALVGLAIGGGIFNYVDDKSRNIYNSWIIHMFADFAIMTIWYIHI